jgi:hypothetical protein
MDLRLVENQPMLLRQGFQRERLSSQLDFLAEALKPLTLFVTVWAIFAVLRRAAVWGRAAWG